MQIKENRQLEMIFFGFDCIYLSIRKFKIIEMGKFIQSFIVGLFLIQLIACGSNDKTDQNKEGNLGRNMYSLNTEESMVGIHGKFATSDELALNFKIKSGEFGVNSEGVFIGDFQIDMNSIELNNIDDYRLRDSMRLALVSLEYLNTSNFEIAHLKLNKDVQKKYIENERLIGELQLKGESHTVEIHNVRINYSGEKAQLTGVVEFMPEEFGITYPRLEENSDILGIALIEFNVIGE